MKKISILFLLLASVQTNYCMEKKKDNKNYKTNKNIQTNEDKLKNTSRSRKEFKNKYKHNKNKHNYNTIEETKNKHKHNTIDDTIKFIKNTRKEISSAIANNININRNKARKKIVNILNNILNNEIINKKEIILQLLSFHQGHIKLKELVINLFQKCINTKVISKIISEITKVNEGKIKILIDYIIGKHDIKNSIQKQNNQLTRPGLRVMKNLTIGGTLAICTWALGHGICHNAMELFEPTTLSLALSETLLTIIATYYIYTARNELKAIRTGAINMIAELISKLIDTKIVLQPYADNFLNFIAEIDIDSIKESLLNNNLTSIFYGSQDYELSDSDLSDND
ncbi:MAG: hypothetical protein M0R03_19515 [Novosphingobium sp.]|nr:hypothetical protein [Novosphingobium sp.]